MKLIIFCLFAALLLASCREEKIIGESEHAIMRIGAATLTERELLAVVGEDASPEEKLNFIREWSNTELTYQAAKEMGLHKNEHTQRIIHDMERNLLSVLYIQSAVKDAHPSEILPSEIHEEFQRNSHLYIRQEPVIRAARIVVDNLRTAWQIRDGLTVENFRPRSMASSLEETLPFDSIAFLPQSAFEPPVWNIIFNTRNMGLTAPIGENGRYSIYLVLQREQAGTSAPLEEVMDLVKRSILARKQNNVVGDIFARLRNRPDYTFDREFMANLGRELPDSDAAAHPLLSDVPATKEQSGE